MKDDRTKTSKYAKSKEAAELNKFTDMAYALIYYE